MGRKMCYDWETNTRKIKSNIDKYTYRYIGEQQLKYLLSTKICVVFYIELTSDITM